MTAALTLIGLATGIVPAQVSDPPAPDVYVDLAWINEPAFQREVDRFLDWIGDPGPELTARQWATERCESGHNPRAVSPSGRYRGSVQWLRSTWDAAAAIAGEGEWVGVDPIDVPIGVQRRVFVGWWDASNPATQWPVCSRRAA